MDIINVDKYSESILNNLVLIGGSARSGTTIIGNLIGSFKNIEYYFEPPMLVPLLMKSKMLDLKYLFKFYLYDEFLLNRISGRNLNFNINDDTYILNTKTEKEIQERMNKSFRRIEFENHIQTIKMAIKSPDLVFFLKILGKLYPHNKIILMHRNANDVINSILKKRWFSDEFLNENHPSEIYATKIIERIKVPYWVTEDREQFWINTSELNRCAYYYIMVEKNILKFADNTNTIILDYDNFVKNPLKTLDILLKFLNLKKTEKTDEIISYVKYKNKMEVDFLDEIDIDLKEKIIDINVKMEKYIVNG